MNGVKEHCSTPPDILEFYIHAGGDVKINYKQGIVVRWGIKWLSMLNLLAVCHIFIRIPFRLSLVEYFMWKGCDKNQAKLKLFYNGFYVAWLFGKRCNRRQNCGSHCRLHSCKIGKCKDCLLQYVFTVTQLTTFCAFKWPQMVNAFTIEVMLHRQVVRMRVQRLVYRRKRVQTYLRVVFLLYVLLLHVHGYMENVHVFEAELVISPHVHDIHQVCGKAADLVHFFIFFCLTVKLTRHRFYIKLQWTLLMISCIVCSKLLPTLMLNWWIRRSRPNGVVAFY